jgi:hypothetical protein
MSYGVIELPVQDVNVINTITFDVAAAGTPTISIIDCVLANTDYNVILPVGVRSFVIKPKGSAPISFTYQSGAIDETLELGAGSSYARDNIKVTVPINLYIRSKMAGAKVSLEYWI